MTEMKDLQPADRIYYIDRFFDVQTRIPAAWIDRPADEVWLKAVPLHDGPADAHVTAVSLNVLVLAEVQGRAALVSRDQSGRGDDGLDILTTPRPRVGGPGTGAAVQPDLAHEFELDIVS